MKKLVIFLSVILIAVVLAFFIFLPKSNLNGNSYNQPSQEQNVIQTEDKNCEKPVFTAYFVDPKLIQKVGQIGVVHGSGQFVVERSYVSFLDKPENQKISIYAPTDMILTTGAYYKAPPPANDPNFDEEKALPDYVMEFDAGCGVQITFAHLKGAVPSIAEQLPNLQSDSRTNQLKPVEFKAGDLVGYFIQNSGVAGIDFIVRDEEVTNQFANQERHTFGYGSTFLHAVCPYDYYEENKKQEYYNLLGGAAGTIFNVKECGPMSRDFPGTISGQWFLDKEVKSRIYDYYRDGDYPFALPIIGDEESVTLGGFGGESKHRIYSGSNPTYKLPKDITTEHCYQLESSGWAYFKIVDENTMQVYYSRSGSCPNVFPQNQGKTYYR